LRDRLITAPQHALNLGHRAAQSGKVLGRWHAHEGFDGFPENVRLVYIWGSAIFNGYFQGFS